MLGVIKDVAVGSPKALLLDGSIAPFELSTPFFPHLSQSLATKIISDCQRYKNESVTADKGLNADVSVYDTRLKYLKPFGKDPIFSELAFNEVDYDEKAKTLLQTVEEFQRGKRGAVQLGLMMKCATGCSPLDYNGYGCFCGFLGSGMPVDGIDK